ncbi:Trk system potassium transporter TrkA [Halalkalicoccus subterraneus]|uniref:Trk system potassium transporter TrkA n=1 Tax=Halalkalicoccus subterraneus TaxID=2675002 RepID=UPI000EFCBC8D|nr:Trk system potassium transporter TrkA [Halalkalicoccus subterraneus]
MDILIVGAGDVGSNLARDLADTHEITVIDRNPDLVDTLTAQLDITGITADGRSLVTLKEAGLENADIVIASTDNDATNVMVCTTANRIGSIRTIARVKDAGLFQVWQSSDGGFGVDAMLCVDLLAAQDLVQTLTVPGARSTGVLADGMAEVAEFHIGEDTPITDRTVADGDTYPSLTFAAIIRDERILPAEKESVIRAEDSLVVIGSPTAVSRLANDIAAQPVPQSDDTVIVAGGGTIGYQIARLFEQRGLDTRLVEHDPERISWLEDRLKNTSVIEADVTDVEAFGRKQLPNTDLLVGATDDDTNYLLAQLAQELGTARTAAIVDDSQVLDIFEEGGIEVAVHPENIVTEEILQSVYHQRTESVSILNHGAAEVLDIVVDEQSILAGDSPNDIAQHLPESFTIGAIIRGETLRTPRAGTIIETGDRVIAFVATNRMDEVTEKI